MKIEPGTQRAVIVAPAPPPIWYNGPPVQSTYAVSYEIHPAGGVFTNFLYTEGGKIPVPGNYCEGRKDFKIGELIILEATNKFVGRQRNDETCRIWKPVKNKK